MLDVYEVKKVLGLEEATCDLNWSDMSIHLENHKGRLYLKGTNIYSGLSFEFLHMHDVKTYEQLVKIVEDNTPYTRCYHRYKI